jgi:hypothetical protein
VTMASDCVKRITAECGMVSARSEVRRWRGAWPTMAGGRLWGVLKYRENGGRALTGRLGGICGYIQQPLLLLGTVRDSVR